MSETIASVRMGAAVAWFSLALAVSVQGGAVIWWAGTLNTRLTTIEGRVTDLQSATPITSRQVIEADRRIAVIDERIAQILARLEALTAELERIHETR